VDSRRAPRYSCIQRGDLTYGEQGHMVRVSRAPWIWIAACSVLLLSSLCGRAEFYAVIVGVADYPGTGSDLAFTDDDALDVRDALLSYPNWSIGNVVFLLDSAATKLGVQNGIGDLVSTTGPDDVLVFFFSGHGATGPDVGPLDEVDGIDEYLCTYGSSLEDFIRDDELQVWLAALPMERIVVLIDTCFSGGMAKGVKSINVGPAPRAGDGFCDDLEELTAPYTKQDLDDLTGKDLVVLTAADDHEYAYELGHPYCHGLFSYYLIEAMLGGAPEGPAGWISAESSFLYLEPRVVALSDSYGLGQHPQLFDERPEDLAFLDLSDPEACWSFGWKRLRIEGNGTADVEVGVASDGSDCYDLGLDLPAPPPVPGDDYTRAWLQVDAGCGSDEILERDVRHAISCGEAETWYLHVEDGGIEESVRISWDHPLFDPPPACLVTAWLTRWPTELDPDTGQYWIDVSGATIDRVDMLQTGSYTYAKSAAYEHSGFTVTIDCRPCAVETADLGDGGWYMVSLPGELCDPCTWTDGRTCGDLVCAFEDNLDPCFAYRYDAELGGYYRVPPANQICYRPGMSAWIHLTEADTKIDAGVMAIGGSAELPLGNGWNQIGNPYTFAISLNAFSIRRGLEEKTLFDAQAAGWISATLYTYDTPAGNYAEILLDTGCLPPWTGCWLRTFVEGCMLVISPAGCATGGPMSRPLRAEEIRARRLELPPPPPELGAMTPCADEVMETLSVINTPNPIRSEHTTVFKVQGAGVEQVDEIRVDIYDQRGQRVFTQRVAAKELVWHTVNDAGELLANGVYLYQVWVRIGEGWYPMGIQRLAVVR